MNRVAVVVVTLAVIAGSVPAAATLADDSTQSVQGDGAEPGAAFAGVVAVQQAEVDNEVAERSLAQQFAAARSSDAKARVVADQSQRLDRRLDELEAEKARLEQARENDSIGQGEYRARLAGLAAGIRALERQANRTADVAQSLPEESLRASGANVSAVRSVAQQANRTGGGEVAEAARSIAGKGVGNGLGPPNASERGPPEGVGGPPDGVGPDQNDTDSPGVGNGAGANATGPPEGVGPEGDIGPGNATGPGESGPPNATGAVKNVTDRAANATNVTTGPPDGDNRGKNVTTGAGNVTVPGGNGTNVIDRGKNVSGGNGVGVNGSRNASVPDNPVPNGTESNGTETGVLGTDVLEVDDEADGDDADGDEEDGDADDDEDDSDDTDGNEEDGDADDDDLLVGDDTETESTPTPAP